MEPTDTEGGYSRLVLYRLDTLATDVQRVEDKVEALLIDVAMLKVKAGVWGAMAGAIPAGAAVLIAMFL